MPRHTHQLPTSSFFFNAPPTTEIYTLSLHDALPISILEREPKVLNVAPPMERVVRTCLAKDPEQRFQTARSEEHTSELQSRRDLVCRLLLEKKKKGNKESACHTLTSKHRPDVALSHD